MYLTESSRADTEQRRALATYAWKLLHLYLPIEAHNESSVMAQYRGFYLNISFDMEQAIMVICLGKEIKHPSNNRQLRRLNELNTRSILGSHSIHDCMGCYLYRLTVWLEKELTSQRLFEVLDHCVEEAYQGLQSIDKVEQGSGKTKEKPYKIVYKNFIEIQ